MITPDLTVEKPVSHDDVPPAGNPGQCFWCNAKFGEYHKPECVTLRRKVMVTVAFSYVKEYPCSWDDGDIRSHLEDSSSCANNILTDITSYADSIGMQCLCGIDHKLVSVALVAD